MRSSLKYLLMASVAISLAALVWPDTATVGTIDASAPRVVKTPAAGTTPPAPAAASAPGALSLQLTAGRYAAAASDPFGMTPSLLIPPVPGSGHGMPLTLPPPVPSSNLPPPVSSFSSPAPVPVPAPTFRYLGQLLNPAGQLVVYLSSADKDVAVSTGTELGDGYSVTGITRTEVRLTHVATGSTAVLPIPASKD